MWIFFALFLLSWIGFSTLVFRPFLTNWCFGSCCSASSMLSYMMSNPFENGPFVLKLEMNIVCVFETLNLIASSCFNYFLERLAVPGWITWIWNCLLCRWRWSTRCRMQTVCRVSGLAIANLVDMCISNNVTRR